MNKNKLIVAIAFGLLMTGIQQSMAGGPPPPPPPSIPDSGSSAALLTFAITGLVCLRNFRAKR